MENTIITAEQKIASLTAQLQAMPTNENGQAVDVDAYLLITGELDKLQATISSRGKGVVLVVSQKWSKQEYTVTVEKNKSIKVECFYKNHVNPRETSVTFLMGEKAEHSSYNLSYFGEITGITEKTVTFNDYGRGKRLSIADFCWRNWDFNIERAIAHNSEEMYHI